MPIDLSAAESPAFAPKIKTLPGFHNAYFVAFGDRYTETSRFKCENCNGNGRDPKRGDECYRCKGAGRVTETKVPLRFEVDGQIEEKHVTFKLTDGLNGGKASNLYDILSAVSGLRPREEIKHWAAMLPTHFRLPCTLLIEKNANDWVNITKVMPAQNGSGQRPQTQQQPQQQPQQNRTTQNGANPAKDQAIHLLMQRMNTLQWSPEYRKQYASDQLERSVGEWYDLSLVELRTLNDIVAELETHKPQQQQQQQSSGADDFPAPTDYDAVPF